MLRIILRKMVRHGRVCECLMDIVMTHNCEYVLKNRLPKGDQFQFHHNFFPSGFVIHVIFRILKVKQNSDNLYPDYVKNVSLS
jgi:hypothetical protein